MPGINNNNQEARPIVASGLLASKHIWQGLIDLVFPPRCAHCGRVDWRWCPHCVNELRTVPISGIRRTLPHNSGLDALYSSGDHTGILQSAVKALKYDAATEVVDPLGDRLARIIIKANVSFDMIIPVPLHAARLSQRGYNQANEIAQCVALCTGIRCEPAAITRQRETRTQVGLNKQERQANVSDAFHATRDLSGQRILLVDDVYTTGATIAACAQAARTAGASKIIGLTVTAARIAAHRL